MEAEPQVSLAAARQALVEEQQLMGSAVLPLLLAAVGERQLMVSADLPCLLEAAEESEAWFVAVSAVAGMPASPGAQPEPAEWPQPGDRPWAVLSLQEVPWLQAGLQQAAECGDFPGVFQPAVEQVSRSEVEFQASP